MTIYVSLLIALIGMVGYIVVAEPSRWKEICRIAFAMGLLSFLLLVSKGPIEILR